MRTKLKLILASTFGLLLLGFSLVPAQPAYAALFDNAKNEACNGITFSNNPSAGCTSNGAGKVNNTLAVALNLFSLVVGVLAIIMIIIGGVKFVTSQGDGNAVASARNTILYAIVGLIIVAFAQIIVRFVLTKANALPACPTGKTQISKPGDCTP